MSTLAPALQPPQNSQTANEPAASWILDARTGWWVFLVLALLVWLPRMIFRGFWVDEAGTFVMAHKGITAAIRETSAWPGQSILYSVIASLFCINSGPLREFLLRLPSALGAVGAAYFVYRLAEAGIGRAAGFLAIVAFILNPLTLQLGTQARPYGLALGAAAASTWFLYRYESTGSRRDLAAYIATSTLVIYFHYFFAAIFAAHVLYALYGSSSGKRTVRWLELIGAYLLIGLFATPLIPHIRLLFVQAHALHLPGPSVLTVLGNIIPVLLVFGLFLSALIIQFLFPSFAKGELMIPRELILLGILLWLLGPVLSYAISLATPYKIYVQRYVSYTTIGQALLFAYAGWFIFESRIARAWILLAVVLSTASPLSIAQSRHPGEEDLRPMMRVIRDESSNGSLPPVFFCSPLPESNAADWKGGIATTHFYAPFVAYPMPNKLLPLPYRLDRPAREEVNRRIDSELKNYREVLFVTHGTNSDTWIPWMVSRMAQSGFDSRIEPAGAYVAVVFRRQP
jgi:hypothetical protein